MLLLAIEHQLDRELRLFGQRGADDAGDLCPELAAEPAAHVLRDHPHVRLRDVQAGGQPFARRADALRRDPRRQVVAVPFADRAVRFEADVRDDVRGVGLIDAERGLLEAAGEVARLLRLALADVAACEHRRRVAGQRLIHQDDGRQHVVLNLDQPRRVNRVLLGIGRHCGDLVTLEHHGIALRVGRIAPHDRGFDTRRAPRRLEVDRDDSGVRIRRADDPPVEHARPRDVEGVLRLSGDLVRTVEALHRGAEHGLRLRPVVFGIGGRRRRLSLPAATLRRRRRGFAAAATALCRRLTLRGCRRWRLDHVSHGSPPSRSTRLRRCGRTFRSGRCSRRAPS